MVQTTPKLATIPYFHFPLLFSTHKCFLQYLHRMDHVDTRACPPQGFRYLHPAARTARHDHRRTRFYDHRSLVPADGIRELPMRYPHDAAESAAPVSVLHLHEHEAWNGAEHVPCRP